MDGIDELGRDARTVPELINDAKEVLDWAKQLGANVPDDNWIKHTINRGERMLAEPTEKKRRELFRQFYSNPIESQNNISDLIHLGFMRRHLGEQSPDVLKDKLTLAMRGADSVKQETAANTKYRDTRFELSVCARLNERGYTAVLAEPNPDIFAVRKKLRAAIECKRIFSQQGIDKRILEAWKQLKERPGNQHADLRVIYCDVTRAFTEGNKHLQGDMSAVLTGLETKMYQLGENILKLLGRNGASEVDAVVLVYQDYIEPIHNQYVLRGITQHLVVINAGQWPNHVPMVSRKRRRLALHFFKKLDKKGQVYYEDIPGPQA
ncbi:MAG TPA: hypothetical protein VMB52_06255 [Verrucomicrobiae bacterium]|nr:hypothetical protein [Verrucomicrobiae bacterium]